MKIPLSLAALAAAVAGGPALAQTQTGAPTVTVHYADLDLSREAGRRVLDRRIGIAIREACGTASDVNLRGKIAVQACLAETRSAVAGQRSAAIASARQSADDRNAAGD